VHTRWEAQRYALPCLEGAAVRVPRSQASQVRQKQARFYTAAPPMWPIGRLEAVVEARGSPRHDLALKEASGEPAGRNPSHLVPDVAVYTKAVSEKCSV
jgi:hypothetical protein